MSLRRIFFALAALAGAALSPAGPALAQNASAATAAVVRVDLAAAGGGNQSLSLPTGKSAIIELPVDARDVLVTNPAVADAMLRSPRRIFILGLKSGQTDAVFFDTAGRRILSLDIRVDQDTAAVAQTINRVVSGSRVRVDAMNDTLILSGQVPNVIDADRAMQVARAAVAKPEMVINMLSIADKDQVMLKVRIVEMQRNVIKQLGFNLNAVLGQLGETQYLVGTAAQFAVNGALLGGLSGGYFQDTTKQPTMLMPCIGPGWLPDDKCPVVVRDSTAAGKREDKSGKLIAEIMKSWGVEVADYQIVPDEPAGIARKINEWVSKDIHFVFTTGGTGLSPRDNTVDAVKKLFEKEAPGIAEAMRAYGMHMTPKAMHSRSVAGSVGKTLVVCLPGSTGGVRESLAAVLPGLFHARSMLLGGGH